MNVDNIKYLFCLFMNNLTSLLCELARLAIYQPREFLSVWANFGHWMLLAVKQTVESACGAGILCRKAAKRTSPLIDLAARLHLAPIICPQGVRIWLLFHRKFINYPLKHCSIWKKRQFKRALKAAQISQNWKKTSKRNCSEITQKVA